MNTDELPDRDLDPPEQPEWDSQEYAAFVLTKVGELIDSPEWFDVAPDALVDHPEAHYIDLRHALMDEDAAEVGRIVSDGVRTWIKTYLESRY